MYTDLERYPDDEDIVLVTPVPRDLCPTCQEYRRNGLEGKTEGAVVPIEFEGLIRRPMTIYDD